MQTSSILFVLFFTHVAHHAEPAYNPHMTYHHHTPQYHHGYQAPHYQQPHHQPNVYHHQTAHPGTFPMSIFLFVIFMLG